MPSHCCVPLCSQEGYRLPNGEKVSFFNFPKDETKRKQWIHAIRRDEGNYFIIRDKRKICSLHFKPDDLKKSLNGRFLPSLSGGYNRRRNERLLVSDNFYYHQRGKKSYTAAIMQENSTISQVLRQKQISQAV